MSNLGAQRTARKYGWMPDVPQAGDRRFDISTIVPEDPKAKSGPPSSYDLRTHYKLPDVYDQGSLGSCTANAIGFCWQFALLREKRPAPTPSRLFIYYLERLFEGTVAQDSGARLRDGMAALEVYGCCDENLWAYDPTMFAIKPPVKAFATARKHEAQQFFGVNQDQEDIIAVIASGFPVAIGFTAYASFESDAVTNTGIVPMPQPGEQVLGGHAVPLIGYDMSSKMFLARNSWGKNWGQSGYFWMPFDYVLSFTLSNSFWMTKRVR